MGRLFCPTTALPKRPALRAASPPPLIGRREAAELKPWRVEAARHQLPRAFQHAVADGFDAPQWKIFGRIDLHRDVLPNQGAALIERKAVGRTADRLLRIFGGGCNHGAVALERQV